MDFSLFGPLLALREELVKATDLGTPHDKGAIALLKRVAQQRERTLALIAKADPASRIDEVFRAASAPLPARPDEDPRPALMLKTRRSTNKAKTAEKATTAAKTAKPAKKSKAKKGTKAKQATK